MIRILIPLLIILSSSLPGQNRSIGVVTINKYEKSDSLVFYNDDKTVWLKFDPYFREDESSFTMPSNFSPLAFHPDYFLLVLRVVEIKGGFAKVVIDEDQKKYSKVDLNSQTLKYLEWSDFISGISEVELPNKNEIYKTPESELKIDFSRDEYIEFKPHKVSDDWLQIKWSNGNESYSGWVKWRDEKDNLLVNFYYFN